MPNPDDIRKFKMGLLGYDPTEDMNKIVEEKMKQTQPLEQQPTVTQPQISEQPQNTGMPNLNMDASRDNFFINLQKLLNRG